MEIKGEVVNRNEQARGHSQVRCDVTVDIGDGVARKAELIISTQDAAVVQAFPTTKVVNASVSLSDAPPADPK